VSAPGTGNERGRLRLVCRGAVQGVGFRPFVFRLARELHLGGFVRNGPEGVTIEVEGPGEAVEAFARRLREEPPPLARLDDLVREAIPPRGDGEFVVETSREGTREGALVPPDAVICPDCRREMEDPEDRRYRYPFTGCASCGPRFTLVREFPWDRSRTSMACFPLCPDCRREYEDPADRRFHTEPLCCPACGPRTWLADRDGRELAREADALDRAARLLAGGGILAVKGLGGFQLACRADREDAVAGLRRRKGRPAKPFALMARDLGAAERLVRLREGDRRLLAGPRGPIVLAPRRRGARVAAGVAPGLDDLGVMLPTTPLHLELFRRLPAEIDALVMTSGNLSDEPIARGNREALARLGRLADGFLLHDRDVVRRLDDSVVRAAPGGAILLRRARGWVPEPVRLPFRAPQPVLAVGAHLQVAPCAIVDDLAFPGQHVGDLDTAEARAFHREALGTLEAFLETTCPVVACDLHPDYASTWMAEELAGARGASPVRVQHHVAHAAAVLAEHGALPRAPGELAAALSLDGTGWGEDGTAWGGEWLLLRGDLRHERRARVEPMPLVGGERAVREPWRIVAALLPDLPWERLPLGATVPREILADVARLAAGGGWPTASGAGRLLEAAGALLGLATRNRYEGEAAIRLEALAATEIDPWDLATGRASLPDLPEAGPPVPGAGLPELPSRALLAAAARRLLDGEPPGRVAAAVHGAFCRLAAELAERVFPPGIAVALGGGCLANRFLAVELPRRLARAGFRPLLSRAVPPGDGGIALGQAVLAARATILGSPPGPVR